MGDVYFAGSPVSGSDEVQKCCHPEDYDGAGVVKYSFKIECECPGGVPNKHKFQFGHEPNEGHSGKKIARAVLVFFHFNYIRRIFSDTVCTFELRTIIALHNNTSTI